MTRRRAILGLTHPRCETYGLTSDRTYPLIHAGSLAIAACQTRPERAWPRQAPGLGGGAAGSERGWAAFGRPEWARLGARRRRRGRARRPAPARGSDSPGRVAGMLTTFGIVGWSGGVGLNRRSSVGSIGMSIRGIVPKFIATRSTTVCDTSFVADDADVDREQGHRLVPRLDPDAGRPMVERPALDLDLRRRSAACGIDLREPEVRQRYQGRALDLRRVELVDLGDRSPRSRSRRSPTGRSSGTCRPTGSRPGPARRSPRASDRVDEP